MSIEYKGHPLLSNNQYSFSPTLVCTIYLLALLMTEAGSLQLPRYFYSFKNGYIHIQNMKVYYVNSSFLSK